MLIGIDASRSTIDQRTGTEGYSLHIIRGLIEIGDNHQFRLYFRDTPPPGLFSAQDNVEQVVITQDRLWTHRGLGPHVRKNPVDVLYVPAHVIPWPGIGSVPSVVTAHDLGYKHYPDKHPFFERVYLDWSTRHSVNIARRVIAVSKATAHDLHALYGIPRDKIRVVYSGVDPLLQPVTDEQRIADLRQRLGITGPYILHVGSIQPRKNLSRLVDAFTLLKDDFSDLQLVLAGRLGWAYQSLLERIAEPALAGRVLQTGYVPDDDLAVLYSDAAVYAFPSLYEGFGFPALEAMACGTPVVCANTSSLPELAGEAALTFAPTDTDALARALRRVLSDADLRATLIQQGSERVADFSWQASVEATMNVLIEAAAIEHLDQP